jgi:hypothetical protein
VSNPILPQVFPNRISWIVNELYGKVRGKSLGKKQWGIRQTQTPHSQIPGREKCSKSARRPENRRSELCRDLNLTKLTCDNFVWLSRSFRFYPLQPSLSSGLSDAPWLNRRRPIYSLVSLNTNKSPPPPPPRPPHWCAWDVFCKNGTLLKDGKGRKLRAGWHGGVKKTSKETSSVRAPV